MTDNYLRILEESLVKKLKVLDQIKEVSELQAELLKNVPMDSETFDHCVDEKDLYIAELSKLDDGFDSLYDQIKQELIGNREKYAGNIKRLQSLITEVTDKSVSIQAQESRNKDAVAAYFKTERQNLRQLKKSSNAAYGYYKNMSKQNEVRSMFMDEKK